MIIITLLDTGVPSPMHHILAAPSTQLIQITWTQEKITVAFSVIHITTIMLIWVCRARSIVIAWITRKVAWVCIMQIWKMSFSQTIYSLMIHMTWPIRLPQHKNTHMALSSELQHPCWVCTNQKSESHRITNFMFLTQPHVPRFWAKRIYLLTSFHYMDKYNYKKD